MWIIFNIERSLKTPRLHLHHKLHPIHAGVPQGSILGPILYTIFTADLPEAEQTLTATYADDTAILASHEDPLVATRISKLTCTD
jgi:hypothetical protein